MLKHISDAVERKNMAKEVGLIQFSLNIPFMKDQRSLSFEQGAVIGRVTL